MLGDPKAGQCPDCVTGDNPNWCGPALRHNERSNNGFADATRGDERILVLRGNTVARPDRGGD